jgi:hypothetical protein
MEAVQQYFGCPASFFPSFDSVENKLPSIIVGVMDTGPGWHFTVVFSIYLSWLISLMVEHCSVTQPETPHFQCFAVW